MKKRTRLLLILSILIIAIVGGGAAVMVLKPSGESTADSDGEQIYTVEVKNGTVSLRVDGPSVVEPYRSQDIRSATSGLILEAPMMSDTVEAGDVLIRFDRADQEASVRQAELNLTQAELDLRKAELSLENLQKDLSDKERLYAGGAIARDQVDAARDALTNAQLAIDSARVKVDQSTLLLEKARIELAGTTMTAPFAGVVLKANAAAGDVVSSGAVLITLADVSRVRLNAEVDEYDIGKVTVGLPVSVTSDALPDEMLKSKIELVSPAAEVINNISIFTVSTVLRNEEGLLRPGMSADLSILVSSDSGIVVPSKAISTVRDRSYVKVYENDAVETKRVTIGASDGVNTAVTEGLEEGALVVLPDTGSFSLTGATSTTGTSIVPITVPGTGGGR